VSAALAAAGALLTGHLSHLVVVSQVLNAGLSLIAITVLFALIFKVLPDTEIAWGDVWVGAMMTSVLFTLGKFAIGFYLAHSGLTSVYGAAGSGVILIAWVYYLAQIFYFGAELTQAHARTHGSHRGRTRIRSGSYSEE
jgi:membrane protein